MTADDAGSARRRLTADERALWAQVTATVNPLDPALAARFAADLPPEPQLTRQPADGSDSSVPRAGLRSSNGAKPCVPAGRRTGSRPSSESLDATWDKRLASGRVVPDMVIDLHGVRREAARQLLYSQVANAEARGLRVILVITGKGRMPGPAPADLVPGLGGSGDTRGAIRVSLPRWLGEQGLSARIAAVRRAHPRHGGEGAAYLVLKRKRPGLDGS